MLSCQRVSIVAVRNREDWYLIELEPDATHFNATGCHSGSIGPYSHMGVSIIGGTPKWMIYKGISY